MICQWLTGLAAYLVAFSIICPAWAAHPLITDDTKTQGKGNFLLEINGQYGWYRDYIDGISYEFTGGQAAGALSCGITDRMDLSLSLPYLWNNLIINDFPVKNEHGIGDASLAAKWRLFEKSGFSVALKPAIIMPTGNDEKGLGAGRWGGNLFLLSSLRLGSWDVHANLGYIRNENRVLERENLWHTSLAVTWTPVKNLKLIANIGDERSPYPDSKFDCSFLIGGLIYSINKNIDIDCGLRWGLSTTNTDFAPMAGIAFRY